MIGGLLNPVNWVKAFLKSRKEPPFNKAALDLELSFYAKILRNDMLHYGYFEDPDTAPETISLQQIEDAQIRYAAMIMSHIANADDPVLDIGCGIGGLTKMMHGRGIKVEALTPNNNQVEYIRAKQPQVTLHHCKFEDMQPAKRYGTLINSESLQYIDLERGFAKAEELVMPRGRWIITDYFRVSDAASNKGSHKIEDLRAQVKKWGWEIAAEEDITPNVIPTLAYLNMFAGRFILPLKHFTLEKLRYKRPWFYHLTADIRAKVDRKLAKEIATIDPVKFRAEKKYMLFVLEKSA